MSIFNRLPKWARMLPSHLRPNNDQLKALEAIRREMSINHNMFFSHIAGHPETTRRLQLDIYRQLKEESPNAPEEDILESLLFSRWSAQGGNALFNLDRFVDNPDDFKEHLIEIVRKYHSCESLIDAILRFESENYFSIPPSSHLKDAANRISRILAENNEAGAAG